MKNKPNLSYIKILVLLIYVLIPYNKRDSKNFNNKTMAFNKSKRI